MSCVSGATQTSLFVIKMYSVTLIVVELHIKLLRLFACAIHIFLTSNYLNTTIFASPQSSSSSLSRPERNKKTKSSFHTLESLSISFSFRMRSRKTLFSLIHYFFFAMIKSSQSCKTFSLLSLSQLVRRVCRRAWDHENWKRENREKFATAKAYTVFVRC